MFEHLEAETNGGIAEITGLAARNRRAARVDVASASDDDLGAAAVELERARAALDAAEAHVLAELEVRGVCDRRFGLGTASWVATRTHASRPQLAARLRVGTALRTMAALDAALSDGELTFEHARAMTDAANPRIVDELAACQDQLIDLARHAPYAIWRRDLGVLVDLLDQDGGYDPERELARNHLHLGIVAGDQVALSGELVGEVALELVRAVEAEADRLWRQFRDDHEVGAVATIPRRSTLLALAVVSLCRRGQAIDQCSSRAPGVDIALVFDTRPACSPAPVDANTTHADTTDAGTTDADTTDADTTADHPIADGPIADRPPVGTDTTDRTGARAGRDEPPGEAPVIRPGPGGLLASVDNAVLNLARGLMTYDGDPLDPERYAHLLCDASFHAVITDSLGVPIDLGRSVRLATPAQRRALAVRDGGCVFPGCSAPAGWCDAHHVIDWERGGLTDLRNLALLCRRHHGVAHRRGWQMVAQPDQTFTWTTPDGLTLTSQRQRGRPPDRAGLVYAA